MKHETREAWLEEAANYLFSDFIGELGRMAKGRAYQISCGWPSSRSQSDKRRRLGECWTHEACADKSTYHIFVSPVLDNPVDVLATLLHELIHAVCGTEVGHKGAFKRIALAAGLVGRMTATVPGDELLKRLNTLARKLGKYPHKALTGMSSRKKQGTRLLKVWCPECEYTVRITRRWLDVGLPTCPDGDEMVEA